jgi:phage-related protein
MFDGSNKDWCPALDMSRKKERRLKTAQFGDGYQQRALDGINNIQRSWAVVYDYKPAEIIDAMEQYLEGTRGQAFPFQDPADGKIYTVFCDTWEVQWQRITFGTSGVRSNLNGTLSAEFQQAYGLTAAGL